MAKRRPQDTSSVPHRTARPSPLFCSIMLTPRHRARMGLAIVLVALSVSPALTGCTKSISDKTVTRIGVDDVARRLEREPSEVLIVDARSANAYSVSRLPGARRIDLGEVEANNPDPALKRYKSIIVYGQNPGAGASMALTKRLMAAGYDDVKLMEDGFDRWSAKGYRIDTSKVEIGVGGSSPGS